MTALYASSTFLLVIAIIGTYFRAYRYNKIALVDWFVIGSAFYGGLLLIVIVLHLENGASPRFYTELKHSNIGGFYPIGSMLAIFGAWLACLFFEKKRPQYLKQQSQPPYPNLLIQKLNRFSWFLLIFSILSYWVYTKPYGGFIGYLDYGALLRSGLLDELGISKKFAFLKRFGGFSFFASLIFSGLIVLKRKQRKPILGSLFGFLLSFLFSVYVLYGWNGRLALVMYILIFPLGYFFVNKGFGMASLFRATLLAIIPILILPVSDQLIWGHNMKKLDTGTFFVKELAFPLGNFIKTVGTSEIRYMKDVAMTPIFFLPARIWQQFGIETLSQVNTKNVTGYKKGEYGSTLTVPIDFITLGYYQAGFLGIFLVGFLFAALLIYIDKWIYSKLPYHIIPFIYAYAALVIAFNTAIYGDPHLFALRQFSFVAGCFLLGIVLKNSSTQSVEPLNKSAET